MNAANFSSNLDASHTVGHFQDTLKVDAKRSGVQPLTFGPMYTGFPPSCTIIIKCSFTYIRLLQWSLHPQIVNGKNVKMILFNRMNNKNLGPLGSLEWLHSKFEFPNCGLVTFLEKTLFASVVDFDINNMNCIKVT